MSLTRDQILAFDDIKPTVTPVDVPEWGGPVLIRPMSGLDRERFENYLAKEAKDSDGNVRARMAAYCLCDEEGRTLFTEADVEALGRKNSHALDRIYQACIRLNALRKDGIDELEKNSDAAT